MFFLITMRYISLILAIGGLSVFPVFAFAANEVSVSGTHDWVLPSDGSGYTITGGTFDSVTISGGTFTFTISGGSSIEILSPDKKKYTVSPSSLATHTCEASQSRLFITKPIGGTTETVTVTPSGACTGSSGSSSSGGGSSGGGGGTSIGLFDPPRTPAGGFTVLINNGTARAGNRKVSLSFNTGSDIINMAVGNSADFTGSALEKYISPKDWDICGTKTLCPAGTYTVYAKFFNANGQSSPVVSDTIQYGAKGSVAIAAMFANDLSLGMTSADVSRLQTLLSKDSAIYPEGLVTGYFGSRTQAAVRRFQEKYGLSLVGRVGPLTRAKLAEVFGGGSAGMEPAAPSSGAVISGTLSLGSQGEEVRTLQTLLSKDSAIYPEGLVTGYFGALTRVAVRRFQEKYSIASQGEAGYGTVGPKTRAKLSELFGK